MCMSCWIEYGYHQIDNELVREITDLIYEVYNQPDGACGGGLHIVLDD